MKLYCYMQHNHKLKGLQSGVQNFNLNEKDGR